MNADAAVRQILSARLGGPSAVPLEMTAETWAVICSRMFTGNVPGLLAASVEAGEVRLDDEAHEQLSRQIVVRMVNDLRAEDESLRVVELLRSRAVESVVLKGLAVAHLDYPDPSQRSTTDVDLLVRAADMERATAVLADAGYRRDLPERRPGFDRRFAKDVTFYGPRRVEIDLHRTLLRGPFGAAIDLDELWAHQDDLLVADLPVRRALDKPSRLLHACYTVAVADARPTLASLCDVALLACDPSMDWDTVRLRAERWRARSIVVDAVATASAVTGVQVRAPFEHPPDRTERRWRRLYRSGGGSLVATTAGLAEALGPIAGLRYMRDLAWPDPAYRRARRKAGRRSEAGAAISAVRDRYRRRPA